jgi:Zn-dependent protease
MTRLSVLMVVLNIALFVPAVLLHEVSHGYVAYLLGDPTAKDAGRLTLNPIPHIDLYGTIILPILMLLTVHFAIGYAKPVPIDPRRMTRVGYKNGMLLTGAAGPLTNLILGTVAGLGFRIVSLFGAPEIVQYMFAFFAFINLLLAFFNLIPIPPLDGSRVVQRFLTGAAADVYRSLERWGILIVLVLVLFVPTVLYAYLGVTVYPLAQFLGGPNLLNVLFKFLG